MLPNLTLRGLDWLIGGTAKDGRPVGLVGKVELGADMARLREECNDLASQVPWTDGLTRQIALQCRIGSENPWYEACVRFEVAEDSMASEADFDMINPALRGSYIGEMLDTIPFRPCRARLMALRPGTCYSVHRDRTVRLHMAIETSRHAQFIFVEHNEVFHVPADGNLYLLNTYELHTAINGGDDLRTHIVLSAG